MRLFHQLSNRVPDFQVGRFDTGKNPLRLIGLNFFSALLQGLAFSSHPRGPDVPAGTLQRVRLLRQLRESSTGYRSPETGDALSGIRFEQFHEFKKKRAPVLASYIS